MNFSSLKYLNLVNDISVVTIFQRFVHDMRQLSISGAVSANSGSELSAKALSLRTIVALLSLSDDHIVHDVPRRARDADY